MKNNYLITGFRPFLDFKNNPSEDILSFFENDFHTKIFNVSYADVDKDLESDDIANYDGVIMFGLSSERNHISIESQAYNEINVNKPDNDNVIITNRFLPRICVLFKHWFSVIYSIGDINLPFSHKNGTILFVHQKCNGNGSINALIYLIFAEVICT